MIGNLENDDDFGRHEGHPGWRIDQIHAASWSPGGVGLGHNGAGGHDTGRRAVPLPAVGQNSGSPGVTGVRDYSSMDGGAGWVRLQPDVILLHTGTNDIGQGADLATVVNRTQNLLAEIFQSLPRVHLFHASLISMLPHGPANSPPDVAESVIMRFNQLLPSLLTVWSGRGFSANFVSLYENTGLCDRDWAAPLGSSLISPECCPDKVHPTGNYLAIVVPERTVVAFLSAGGTGQPTVPFSSIACSPSSCIDRCRL